MVRRVTQRMGDDELSHEQLPPLEPGDRFTRMEFERRYSFCHAFVPRYSGLKETYSLKVGTISAVFRTMS